MSDKTETTVSVESLTVHTVVVGSGAAGYNAADRLAQYGVPDVIVVTEKREAGTSRNTGSDKQTYYKLSLAGSQEDSVRRLAEVLFSGGCMDGDHALCEAALSCQGFFKLVELGVPFPHDSTGEFVGYKTDHDPNDRGTSVGPYTSRYMTEALERSVMQRKIPIYDHHQVVRILTCRGKLYGILCLNTETGRFLLIQCQNLVYATGGPAGIYGDSVYPVSQFGSSGLAFEAGVLGKNLTEWQYGLASLHPRWNVSGSYMQVLPRFVSTDADGGDEREFLPPGDCYDNVFLKGYQWPFDVRKAETGSSLIDLYVYRETCVLGRRVWLDYRQNPGGKSVDFDALSAEARGYLLQAGACQQTPYERLCHLNLPAVEFYREHGVDLASEMLEVAVCAQHNNGGLSVDGWWQTNIEGIFAVGEAAGTHGIYRPGGSALNSGQTGSTRAAEYIAAHREKRREWSREDHGEMTSLAVDFIRKSRAQASDLDFAAMWKKAAQKMSQYGAMLRDPEGMKIMLSEIQKEQEKEETMKVSDGREAGIRTECKDRQALSRYFRYRDMRICQHVYLEAMLDYVDHGGRSRGSAMYLEAEDEAAGESLDGLIQIPGLASFRLDGEDGMAHKDQVQEIGYDAKNGTCQAAWRPVRLLSDIPKNPAFEVVWRNFREGRIYGDQER